MRANSGRSFRSSPGVSTTLQPPGSWLVTASSSGFSRRCNLDVAARTLHKSPKFLHRIFSLVRERRIKRRSQFSNLPGNPILPRFFHHDALLILKQLRKDRITQADKE